MMKRVFGNMALCVRAHVHVAPSHRIGHAFEVALKRIEAETAVNPLSHSRS
jgi:hypothetical protein